MMVVCHLIHIYDGHQEHEQSPVAGKRISWEFLPSSLVRVYLDIYVASANLI